MNELISLDKIDFDLVAKFIAGVSGILLMLNKIRRQLSDFRLRAIIKSDLDILKTCKDAEISTEEIKAKIGKNLKDLYDSTGSLFFSSFPQILIGTTLFVGFGLWTLKIYTDNSGFSPWIILTSFAAASGLTMLFQENKKAKTVKSMPVFTLNVYSWRDLVTGILLLILGVALTVGIYLMYGFTYWQILTVVLAFVGLSTTLKEIEVKMKGQ